MRRIRIAVVVIFMSVILIWISQAKVILPGRFNLAGIEIGLYGLAIATAVLTVVSLLEQELKESNIAIDRLLPWVVLGGVIGARAFHVVSDHQIYSNDIVGVFRIFDGGLSLYGAIIGGGVAVVVAMRKSVRRAKLLLNTLALLLPLGQMIGRLGNFFNQELFGAPSDLPWAIYIEPQKRPVINLESEFFAPLFFYEQLFLFLLLIFSSYLFKVAISKVVRQELFHETWLPLAFYLWGYSVVRIIMEQLRTDPAWLFGFSFGEVISAILLVITTIYIIYFGKNIILRYK